MSDFNNTHAEQLARIETKLDIVIPVVKDHQTRIATLERWRSWTAGVGSVFVAFWAALRTGFISLTGQS